MLVHRKAARRPGDGDRDDQAGQQISAADRWRWATSAHPGLELSGDQAALQKLLGVLDRPDPNFNIVTP